MAEEKCWAIVRFDRYLADLYENPDRSPLRASAMAKLKSVEVTEEDALRELSRLTALEQSRGSEYVVFEAATDQGLHAAPRRFAVLKLVAGEEPWDSPANLRVLLITGSEEAARRALGRVELSRGESKALTSARARTSHS